MTRPWREIAEELSLQPTRTSAQQERFQELTTELLLALPRTEEFRRPMQPVRPTIEHCA